jgi:hypothetical protein
MVPIHDWLEALKPGWGNKYSDIFVNLGAETDSDLYGIEDDDDDFFDELHREIPSIQMTKLKKAIVKFVKVSAPATLARTCDTCAHPFLVIVLHNTVRLNYLIRTLLKLTNHSVTPPSPLQESSTEPTGVLSTPTDSVKRTCDEMSAADAENGRLAKKSRGLIVATDKKSFDDTATAGAALAATVDTKVKVATDAEAAAKAAAKVKAATDAEAAAKAAAKVKATEAAAKTAAKVKAATDAEAAAKAAAKVKAATDAEAAAKAAAKVKAAEAAAKAAAKVKATEAAAKTAAKVKAAEAAASSEDSDTEDSDDEIGKDGRTGNSGQIDTSSDTDNSTSDGDDVDATGSSAAALVLSVGVDDNTEITLIDSDTDKIAFRLKLCDTVIFKDVQNNPIHYIDKSTDVTALSVSGSNGNVCVVCYCADGNLTKQETVNKHMHNLISVLLRMLHQRQALTVTVLCNFDVTLYAELQMVIQYKLASFDEDRLEDRAGIVITTDGTFESAEPTTDYPFDNQSGTYVYSYFQALAPDGFNLDFAGGVMKLRASRTYEPGTVAPQLYDHTMLTFLPINCIGCDMTYKFTDQLINTKGDFVCSACCIKCPVCSTGEKSVGCRNTALTSTLGQIAFSNLAPFPWLCNCQPTEGGKVGFHWPNEYYADFETANEHGENRKLCLEERVNRVHDGLKQINVGPVGEAVVVIKAIVDSSSGSDGDWVGVPEQTELPKNVTQKTKLRKKLSQNTDSRNPDSPPDALKCLKCSKTLIQLRHQKQAMCHGCTKCKRGCCLTKGKCAEPKVLKPK